jgi:tetratricopeptide (TPR) repeat protein
MQKSNEAPRQPHSKLVAWYWEMRNRLDALVMPTDAVEAASVVACLSKFMSDEPWLTKTDEKPIAKEEADATNQPQQVPGRVENFGTFEVVASSMPLSEAERAEIENAIELHEAALSLNPRDHQTLEVLRDYYTLLGLKKERVITAIRLVLEYLQNGLHGSLVDEHEYILSVNSSDPGLLSQIASVRNLFDMKNLLIKQGRSDEPLNESQLAAYKKTIEILEIMTLHQPLDFELLEALREAYRRSGANAEVWRTDLRLVFAYKTRGLTEDLLATYRRMLVDDPKDADALAGIAEIEGRPAPQT